ncbi:MAG: hypothetical protein AAF721_35645 [Myxococcota bacterium]
MSARAKLLCVVAATLWLGATGCDAREPGTEVGPRGGVVTSEDGRVTLDVPPGALLDTIELSIVPVEDAPDNAIGPAYAIEPFGVAFVAPAMIAYDVSDCRDHDPEAVRLVTERGDGWDSLSDRELDLERAELSATVLFAAAVTAVE